MRPNASDIEGLWNTTAGGDGTLSSPGNGTGNYNPQEIPQYVFDSDSNRKHNSYGFCNKSSTSSSPICGLNTGFYIKLQPYPSLLIAFRFRTANNLIERDPLIITIEGSNQNSSNLLSGSSWTLIYNGSTGLETAIDRFQFGTTQWLSDNWLWFQSYRILVLTKRNSSNAVQYGEMELYGYYY